MLKKLTGIAIIGMLFCAPLFSRVNIGIKGGLNINQAKADNFTEAGYNYNLRTLNNLNTGFHFGLFSQFKVYGILIQPEVLFTSVRNDLEYKDLEHEEVKKIRQDFNYLDVPVLALLKYKSVKLELGPVGSILLDEESFLFDETGYRQKFNIFSLGYQAGLGFDNSKIAFDVRYEGRLTSTGDLIEIGNEKFKYDSTLHQLIFSFGVFF